MSPSPKRLTDLAMLEFDQIPRYRRSNADKLLLALFIALISAGILWFVTWWLGGL